ncbi:MAG: type II secretion system GspH family protein [Planctomycetota bacterium]|nr:type II secretion system GspH family protein [Planctomycetota bacterium]
MRMRKAFTLAELLVVMGVIALLAAILLPAISNAYRSAQMDSQRADLQSIAMALEAYKSDFGDYPRNANLQTWVSQALANPPPGNAAPGNIPPIYFSLATALIGPGPAETQNVPKGGKTVEAGDGADGAGFRTRSDSYNASLPIGPFVAGSTNLSVSSVPPGWVAPTATPLTIRQATGFSSITVGVGKPNQETIGVDLNFVTNGTVGLLAPTAFIHAQGEVCILRTATGKAWPPYLPAEKFNIKYVFDPLYGTKYPWQPEMLDRWGTPIQYFPRYGPVTNRTNDSKTYAPAFPAFKATVIAGPLFGISAPFSVDAKFGDNAIWDSRDATDPAFATPTPTYDPSIALRWMLGDDSFGPQGNLIVPPMTLRYSGEYILLSAGPSGAFCNFLDPTTGNPFPQTVWQAKFKTSRNIYNFDR